MIEVRRTTVFADWLKSLKDAKTAAKIAQRIVRLQSGLLGDVRPVGGGVSELRIDYGPGFRLYFVRRGRRSSCSSVAETRARRKRTSGKRRNWQPAFNDLVTVIHDWTSSHGNHHQNLPFRPSRTSRRSGGS